MSCKPNQKQIERYNSRKNLNFLIILSLVISTLGISQLFLASDSIVEINFSEDFEFDESIIVEIFNTTSFKSENVSLIDIDFNIINFQLVFYDKDLLISTLNQEEKYIFQNGGGRFFTDIINDLRFKRNLVFSKGIGTIISDFDLKNNTYKIRIPRNLVFYGINLAIGTEINYFVDNISDQITFSKNIVGIPENNYDELITNYNKLIINLNEIIFNQTSFELENILAEKISNGKVYDIDDIPIIPSIYINTTIDRGYFLEDIFDPTIK